MSNEPLLSTQREQVPPFALAGAACSGAKPSSVYVPPFVCVQQRFTASAAGLFRQETIAVRGRFAKTSLAETAPAQIMKGSPCRGDRRMRRPALLGMRLL